MARLTKIRLARSTAQDIYFHFYNSSTGALITSPGTLTAKRTLWAGSETAADNTPTHVGNGLCKYITSADDTEVRWVNFKFESTASNAIDVEFRADCGYPQTTAEIQADIDACSDGDVVELDPEVTYGEAGDQTNVVIDKPLTIEGNNAEYKHWESDCIKLQPTYDEDWHWSCASGGLTPDKGDISLDMSEAHNTDATLSVASVVNSTTTKIDVDAGDYTCQDTDVGKIFQISGGTATDGSYTIQARSGQQWTLDSSAGTVGQTAPGWMGSPVSGVSDGDMVRVKLGGSISHNDWNGTWDKLVKVMSVNQKQRVTLDFTGETPGGTFTLTYTDGTGPMTTAAIAYDADESDIESALGALARPPSVSVSFGQGYYNGFGGSGPTGYQVYGWFVEFTDGESETLMTIDDSGTDGTGDVRIEFEPWTLDRPVEYTIWERDATDDPAVLIGPNNSDSNQHDGQNHVMTFTSRPYNVTIRNLRVNFLWTTSASEYIYRWCKVRATHNIVFENLVMDCPYGFIFEDACENVVLRNIQFRSERTKIPNNSGRLASLYGVDNLLLDNVSITSNCERARGIVAEIGVHNMLARNTQVHNTALTRETELLSFGGRVSGRVNNYIENTYFLNTIVNTYDAAGDVTDVNGAACGYKSVNPVFNNVIVRSANGLMRGNTFERLQMYDDSTLATVQADPTIGDDYHYYHVTQRYFTRIDLTNSMSNEEFRVAEGMSIKSFGIYVSEKTGLTACELRTESSSTDSIDIIGDLVTGHWTSPWWLDPDLPDQNMDRSLSATRPKYGLDDWVTGQTDDGSAWGRYSTTDDQFKVLRISTTSVSAGAYILVSVEAYIPQDEQYTGVGEVWSATDVQQVRYRLGIDGTTDTPSASAGLLGLVDDAITSAKFDESTAYPLASADSGSTQVARVGADGDTLETLSDQLDAAQADLGTVTGTDGVTLATAQANYAPATASALSIAQTDLDTITGADGVTLATAQALYAPAKAGDAMDLITDALDADALATDAVNEINTGNFWSSAEQNQIRYRLGLDGTTAAPSGSGGAKLYDVDGYTTQESARIIAAACAGKIVTAGQVPERFLGLDGLTERIVVSGDATGNRTTVTYS